MKYLGTFGNASLFARTDRNCAKRRTSFGMNTYRSNDEANRGKFDLTRACTHKSGSVTAPG